MSGFRDDVSQIRLRSMRTVLNQLMKMDFLGRCVLLTCVIGCTLAIKLDADSEKTEAAKPAKLSQPIQLSLPYRRYDMEINLSNGVVSGSDPSISWYSKLKGFGRCNKRGVLKLRFNSAGLAKRKVRIDMVFSNPKQYTFNIGDSRTNNGWGGDSRTQSRDAEVFSYTNYFYVYSNDHHNPKGHRYVRKRIVHTETNTLELIISDGIVTWNNGASYYNSIIKNDLFALKGQRDTEGKINYDIYLGMNRVIAGDYRKGTGLCSVGIKWLDGFS